MHRVNASILAVLLLLQASELPAQTSTAQSKPQSSSSSSNKKKKTTPSASAKMKKSSAKKGHAPRKKSTASRTIKLHKTFVASSDLRPMARQLIEFRSPAAYAGVESYATKHAGTEPGALAWFAIGYAHYLDTQYPAAIAALQKAQPYIGELKDYTSYFIGNSYVLSNNAESGLTYLRDFGARFPDSVYANDALLAYARALLATNRPAEAVQALLRRTGGSAEAEYLLGKAYVQNGQNRSGAEVLRRVYYNYPTSQQADLAESELKKIPEADLLPPVTYGEREHRADGLYKGRRWAPAAEEYKAMLAVAPAGQQSQVNIQLANAYMKLGENGKAKEALARIPDDGSEASAEKWYQSAEIARNTNDDAGLTDILQHMRATTPTSPWLESALFTAGNMYLLRQDYDKAIDYYKEIHDRFPNSSKAAYAHWKCAWLTYRQNRPEQARKDFDQQIEFYPGSNEVSNAMYWRGRMAEDDKNYGLARTYYLKLSDRYRNYYYGVAARKRLATLPDGPPVTVASLQRIPGLNKMEPESLQTSPPADDLHYNRSRLLENAGAIDLAVRELQAGTTSGPSWEMVQIARMYTDGGEYYRALQALKRTINGYFAMDVNALPQPYWEGLFPRPYWDALRRYSDENGLDPYLVASLIRQESEFNPGAVSRANAYGLMQLLPKTGKGTAKQVGLHNYKTESLLDPTINIELGTKYFREMVDHFGGQIEYALAAYNAGSSRVEDWRSSGSYRDIEEFVESIPFTETREYVQAIVRNAEVYKRVYKTP
ncbi:MAG TPA: transglycosylase SLT domain-containing protein [Candidatus Eisenbacteria bacterium]|nr:transglycosylase SLT domain-containing protein [Candidatus Eisenbacteria bacterium]